MVASPLATARSRTCSVWDWKATSAWARPSSSRVKPRRTTERRASAATCHSCQAVSEIDLGDARARGVDACAARHETADVHRQANVPREDGAVGSRAEGHVQLGAQVRVRQEPRVDHLGVRLAARVAGRDQVRIEQDREHSRLVRVEAVRQINRHRAHEARVEALGGGAHGRRLEGRGRGDVGHRTQGLALHGGAPGEQQGRTQGAEADEARSLHRLDPHVPSIRAPRIAEGARRVHAAWERGIESIVPRAP